MHNQFTIQNLKKLYLREKKSSSEIAKIFNCSANKINYWLSKYGISKRDISEAIYVKKNPQGDPFLIKKPKNIEEAILWGLGLGIYWGEGNKANKGTIRVGNSDPELLKIFIKFLIVFFGIKREDLRFHLHLFSDISVDKAMSFWSKVLNIKKQQFYKPMVSISGSLGTYRKKSIHGVLTVYYGNTKLKNILVEKLEEYKNMPT
ncbi:hypothetical protein KKF64_03175 [Patescibacteria group bacterium]|nr:hypothetical protein [Patescibacteria group bacterium]